MNKNNVKAKCKYNIRDDFHFIEVMEVWTQWVPCKVNHEPQKNEVYLRNKFIFLRIMEVRTYIYAVFLHRFGSLFGEFRLKSCK